MVTKWQPLPIKEGGTDGTTPKSARRALGISEGVSSDNFVSVKDFPFGAVGDGVTDDTAAFNLARTAALGKTLLITGTPLISSALTITSQEHWVFDGAVGTSLAGTPGSYLIKKSTLAADLVTISGGSASGTKIEGGGILGQAGNGGNGFTILTNGVELVSPWVALMGNDGIRIGSDAGVNANAFRVLNPTCVSNVRRGIYAHDGSGNANGGLVLKPVCLNNGEDGIFFNKALINTIIAPLSETNTGAGLRFGALSGYNVVLGGDLNETNTGGNLVLDSGNTNNYFLGTEYGTASQAAAVDAGTGTTAATILNRSLAQLPTPLLAQTFAQISSAGSAYVRLDTRSANAAARNVALIGNGVVFGDLVLAISTALGGDPTSAGKNVIYVTPTYDVQLTKRLYPGTDAGAAQTASGLFAGTGVPNNANGANGDIYFRSDGGAGTTIYQRRAGAWVATAA